VAKEPKAGNGVGKAEDTADRATVILMKTLTLYLSFFLAAGHTAYTQCNPVAQLENMTFTTGSRLFASGQIMYVNKNYMQTPGVYFNSLQTAQTRLTAGETIELNPGFTAAPQSDGSFTAEINACTGAAPNPDNNNDQKTQQHYVVYPNPATQLLYVKNTKGNKITSLKLLSLNGQIVAAANTNGNTVTTHQVLDVSRLQAGVYILIVYDEAGSVQYKIVKQ
jgi:Secretion system C-terminal sorting domain